MRDLTVPRLSTTYLTTNPMSHPLLIEGMHGLGDNFYQRCVLCEASKSREIFLQTCWPQLYADLPIKCLKPITRLRTQAKNLERSWDWATCPGLVDHQRLHYMGHPEVSMLEALCMEMRVKTDTLDFTGPPTGKPPVEGRYVVVRPSTIRQEWHASARNPAPGLIGQAAQALREHFRIISVADISPPHEILVDPPFEADEVYHRGELHVEQLLSLVANATACVGGVGWLLPACVAYRVPLLLLFGGCLGHNGAARVLDPRMDTRRICGAMPDEPCFCTRSDHTCAKRITGFSAHIDRFLATIRDA